jgi:hypothetical protein
LVWRPGVGLVPLLAGLQVGGWDGAGFAQQLVGDGSVGALHCLWVVFQAGRRGAGPEGVELGDVEGQHVAFWGAGALCFGGVCVGEDVDVSRGGGEVVVEVAEVVFVPHHGCHGFTAVLRELGPGGSGGGVAGAVVEVGDDDFVVVEDGIEVDGDDLFGIDGAEGEVDVVDCVAWGFQPAGGVVPAGFGAGGEV